MRHFFALSLLLVPALPLHAQDDDPPPLVKLGDFRVEEVRTFHRLINNDVMIGTQIKRQYLLPADAPNVFGVGTPWDVLLQEGSFAAWDPRLEPLSYFHRTGPVGAIFHELRTRNGGRDAKQPIGVVGLDCGTPAAYILNGQSITFFESSPDLKKLVADTDRYFTYIGDAKFRGATVDVRLGNARKTLEAAKDRFAVLLIELFDTGFDPGERLTIEAVQLYLSRVREDGIVALHISNKYYRLEPVLAAIAKELNLAARVWNDDAESRPGKTASSWVVLAREEKHLGILGASTVDQVKRFGTKNQLLIRLLRDHPPESTAREALARVADGKGLTIEEFGAKFGGEATVLEEQLQKLDLMNLNATLGDLTELVFGRMFHPLTPHAKVVVRKDGDKAWPRAVLMVPKNWQWLFGPDE